MAATEGEEEANALTFEDFTDDGSAVSLIHPGHHATPDTGGNFWRRIHTRRVPAQVGPLQPRAARLASMERPTPRMIPELGWGVEDRPLSARNLDPGRLTERPTSADSCMARCRVTIGSGLPPGLDADSRISAPENCES